jgi:hypothetical protein
MRRVEDVYSAEEVEILIDSFKLLLDALSHDLYEYELDRAMTRVEAARAALAEARR